MSRVMIGTLQDAPLNNPARIFIVDDHPLVRERLAEIIGRQRGLIVCGEAEGRREALARIEQTRPDLAIIDLTLRNSDGLDLIKDLRSALPDLKMLVVSMHDESLYAERVIRAGASGYITKQEATRKILHAIQEVLAGRMYLNEKFANRLLSRMMGAPHATATTPEDLLTDRELQVFQLLGRGLNVRQIAEQLNIGAKTVETHRNRVREKLNFKDATELLRAAIEWTHKRA